MMEDIGLFQQNKSVPGPRRRAQEGRAAGSPAQSSMLGTENDYSRAKPNKLNKQLKVTKTKYNLSPTIIE